MADLISVHLRTGERYRVEGREYKRGEKFSIISVMVGGESGITSEVLFFMHPGEETYHFVRQMTKALLEIDHEDVLQVLVDEDLVMAK